MTFNELVDKYCHKPPPDAQCRYLGTYYKVGRHGYIFAWTDGEWRRSTVSPSALTIGARVAS